jgi:2-dehydropantoate 2-reductase
MECLIVGAGAIGIAMGTALLESGNRVSFLAGGETKDAIETHGIHRTGLFGTADFGPEAVTVYETYEQLPREQFDYVLICAKTMANDEISTALSGRRDCFRPEGKLVIIQNGWGNDLPYLRYFPKEQVYSVRIITGFRRTERNVSEITVHTAPVLVGSLYGCSPEPVKPLQEAISQVIPCETTMEVGKALWAKMLYNCALNPLGAILKVTYGQLMDVKETADLMNDLIAEIFAVMQAAGYETFWKTPEEYEAAFYGKLVPDTYHHRSSTLQDIERGKKTEIDTLTGTILRLAGEHGVPVPCNTMIYRMIRAIEQNF